MSQAPPSHAASAAPRNAQLRLVAWETTRNCNLACLHCRAAATMGPYEGELDTDQSLNSAPEARQPATVPAMLGTRYGRRELALDSGAGLGRGRTLNVGMTHIPGGGGES